MDHLKVEMSALKVSAVWILLRLFSQVCYCQSQDFPYVSFGGESLANHSHVNLSLVNNTASGSVQCHTDLGTCCTSAQGAHRGDWYFPNGSRLQSSGSGGGDIFQSREAQRVDLRHRRDGTASGIYQCSVPTHAVHDDSDPSVRDCVYVGLYGSGGDITIATDTLDISISETNTPRFTLTCISTGGPATTVTWTRDSVTATEGTETVLDYQVTAQYTHTLTVTGREGGLYTCTVANNKPSNDSSSLTVKVASAPDNLSLKQDGETTILVSWTTPTPLGDTTGYRVDYTTDSNTETSTVSDASTSTISLTSLEPGQHYTISVFGLSEHLPSEPTITPSIFLFSLPKDISVTVNTVTTTTIPLSISISNYNSMTGYNITIAWNQTSCDDEAGIKGLFEGQYNTLLRMSYTIREVYPGDYSIRVTITNVAGSVTSDIVNVSTITRVPSAPPKNIAIDNTTVFTITLNWEPVDCMHQNGKITGYIIQYHPQGRENETINDTTVMLEFTITDLQPYTVYVIGVAAVNDDGIGVYGNVTAKTIPFEVAVKSKTSTTITLAWSEADYTAMKTVNISWMIDYSLCMYDEDVNGQTTNNTVAPYVLTELKAHSNYTITVCVEDLVCESVTETTRESVPSAAPSNVSLSSNTVTSINVAWEPVPCMHRNGDITGYAVMYRELSSGLATYIHETVATRNINITGLKPSTLYEIAVAAFNSVGTGPFTNASLKTDTLDTTGPLPSVTATPNVPTASGDEKTSSNDTAGTVAGVVVSLLVIIGATIGIIVAVLWIRRRRQSEKGVFPTSHFNVIPKRFSTRRSIKMSENLERDEKSIGEGFYSEVPDVVPTVRPHSKLLYCESGDSAKSDNQLVTDEAKPLVPATEKELDEDDSKSKEESDEGDEVKEKAAASVPEPEPIPVALFGSHVENCHSSNNQPFMKEFESLIDGEGKSIFIARSSENRIKNRFANISAYDDNRVILNAMEGYESDYINASYVDGYLIPKKFIAAQGPLPSTLVDFWRMVWQERVPTVVMITNLVEGKKTKCEQYWPSTGSQDFGPFHVTITDQLILVDYTIRTLTVELSGKTRKVTHFHYTGWPDHGVPDYITSILTLRKRIMKDHKTLRGRPILVHCSAGVGRTGTFITIDHVLEQREKEEVVDIAGVIQRLRQQRTKIVQTADQYIFIHDAVLESVTCGDTQIEAGILRKALAQLQNRDETGSTGLDLQLSILDQVSINPDEAKVFTAHNNQAKNRSSHYLPVDKWRVVLKGETPDYIHASSIHGYKQQRAFIIAQGPMKSTSRDFWKMIFSRKCSVIVMLSDLCEQGEEVCYQYWPGQRAQSYGEFKVELINEDKYNGYVLRTFSLQQAKFSKPHQVHQFQVTNWISDHKCADNKTLVTVIDKVSKVQRRTGNNAVIVHGINTVNRSAIFCAATTTIERCKTEGVVDVFQVVKALRAQKPGAIQTVEQYQSIYEAVLVFLASFESYSNFTLQQKPAH